MSDSDPTPLGTARINSERFDTELAAVWYAANYYYESSFRRAREYIGVVFRQADGKYGITVRNLDENSTWRGSAVRIGDVPRGTVPMACWHTHVPCDAGDSKHGISGSTKFLRCIASSLDLAWDEFSSADYSLSDENSKKTLKIWGHRFPIYLITATEIKRYRGTAFPEKSWKKDPPSRMKIMFK